jgi:hypothetical protein
MILLSSAVRLSSEVFGTDVPAAGFFGMIEL